MLGYVAIIRIKYLLRVSRQLLVGHTHNGAPYQPGHLRRDRTSAFLLLLVRQLFLLDDFELTSFVKNPACQFARFTAPSRYRS